MAGHLHSNGSSNSSSGGGGDAILQTFDNYYESFMGLPSAHPSSDPAPHYWHQHQQQHISKPSPAIIHPSTHLLTPPSSSPSSLGMSIGIGIRTSSGGSSTSGHASSSSRQREPTLTPLTTVGSGSESGSYGHPAKTSRLNTSRRAKELLITSDPDFVICGIGSAGPLPYHYAQQHEVWPPHPAQHLLNQDPSAQFHSYGYIEHDDPHLIYEQPYSSSHAGSVYFIDEQPEPASSQGFRRRNKFIAQRRYRAGELVPVPEEDGAGKRKRKGDADSQLPAKRQAKGKSKGKQRATTDPSPPLPQMVCPLERNVDKVANADLPPQACMEVHTLFVRPPASIFEERERLRIREERLGRGKRTASMEGFGLKREDAARAGGRSGASTSSQPKKAEMKGEGDGVPAGGGRRVAKYGPLTAEWTFEYQDDFDPSAASTRAGAGMTAPKKEVKSEDATEPLAPQQPPLKRKRGRKPILDALKVSLVTGVPLHPWAAPLSRAVEKKEEPDGDGSSSALLSGGARSLAKTTRMVRDVFGRVSEYPLPTPQPPYTKTLRDRYRGFAAKGQARLDLERMWRHRVGVWRAERAARATARGETRVATVVTPAKAAPVYLRRNVRMGQRRQSRWDF
ncbi:hypothetical protein V8E36_006995 [Tilletia maclaganii]